MNKIGIWKTPIRVWRKPAAFIQGKTAKDARFYMTDKDKDKDDFEVEEKYKARKGVLHDKNQSVQEESYFHKESQEQLKALKKKVQDKKPNGDDNKN